MKTKLKRVNFDCWKIEGEKSNRIKTDIVLFICSILFFFEFYTYSKGMRLKLT